MVKNLPFGYARIMIILNAFVPMSMAAWSVEDEAIGFGLWVFDLVTEFVTWGTSISSSML